MFIIGHLRGSGGREVFPIEGSHGSINQNDIKQLNDNRKIKETTGFESINRLYDVGGLSPCLNTMSGGGRQPKIMVREATKQGFTIAEPGDSINFEHPNSKTRRGRVGKGIANTLTTSCNQGTLDNFRIRKLTPKECWRLQGFPDWAFDKAEQVNSNSQLYKQAGNSVTVKVIEAIANKI